MLEVAFDESGNTGQNLLDSAQPVYTLAAVARREPEVAGAVADLLEGSDFSELKFSVLRGAGEGRKIISMLFESGLLDPASASAAPVDKEWMVAGKMVALLWEPGIADVEGFFASGAHREIASALQRQGPQEAGRDRWDRWQAAFVAAVRSPHERVRMEELAAALAAVKAAAEGGPVGILLEVVPDDADTLEALIPRGDDELDPALSGLVEQLHRWSQRLEEPFRVVHDDSGVVERWRELLERLSDERAPRRSFELGEVSFEFPLRAPEITTVDSEHSAAVQLADVLSGAVTWCLREKVRGNGVPEEWGKWGLGRFIDRFQGASDFLLGLVEPGDDR